MRHKTRRGLITILASFLVAIAVCVSMNAASNPSGTGQPNQSCGSTTALSNPPGFDTSGFANAESHYAGSDGTPSLLHANSSHAVSQYDVACYQVSNNGPSSNFGFGINTGGH